MLKLPSLARKLMIGGLAAATVAGSLAVSTATADAGWRGHRGHGHHHHRHGGAWIAPAIISGLALGALAAPYAYGAPVYRERCWVEHRHHINRFGEPVVRRIHVCG